MDQRLELQARFRALGLALSFIVEVGEFICLPERQQKSRRRSEPRCLQARSPTPGFTRRKIHRRLQTLIPGTATESFGGAMVFIASKLRPPRRHANKYGRDLPC